MRKMLASVALVIGLGLGSAACSDGYGRENVSLGYNDYYPGYGGYYGWYGDYYYPGYGFNVYDRYRRPFRWNGDQQRYWEARRSRDRRFEGRPNWNGFAQDGQPGFRRSPGYRRDNDGRGVGFGAPRRDRPRFGGGDARTSRPQQGTRGSGRRDHGGPVRDP